VNRQDALDALPVDASVLRSTKQLAEWLGQYEIELPNFQRATISSFLAENTVPPVVEQVLLGRIGATKITSAKVGRAIGLQGEDGRIRNGLMYHAAHTGRWGGRGFQPHNLPRGVEMDVDAAVERIMTTDWQPTDGELGTLIRACIKAPEGESLLVVDWSQIEARVLPWLAGDMALLERIRSGVDIYVAMAELMHTERKIGKVAVLACGYQGGGSTLGAFAEGYGVDFEDLGLSAQQVVEMYRDANPLIAGVWTGSMYEGIKCRTGGLWRDLDAGLKEIAWGRSSEFFGCKCHWFRSGRDLKCKLPSGRHLTYRNFTIEDRVPGWGGDPKPTMVYETKRGVNMSTYGGKLTENVTQAVARDILTESMVKLEAEGFKIVLHVHDEIIVEGQPEQFNRMKQIMCEVPEWADGLPVDVDGFVTQRFRK
jgi:DNA polymerase